MQPFKILSHTADLRLEVSGKNKKELFKNAALALAHILGVKKAEKGEMGERERVKIKSADINSLLVDFLNEILLRSQVDKTVYPEARFKKFSEKNLEAEIRGFSASGFDEDVKAVTYHGVKIQKSKTGFKAELILDI